MGSQEVERTARKKALHKKSRGGCTRCKSRRVKCDEQRPCRNCVRRGEECDLSLPGINRATIECSTCSEPTASLDWGREVYLMNFYTLETASTVMPTIIEATKIFQVWIPQLALTQPHLMRGLIAFAAFHMAYNRPDEATQWFQIAIKNQTAALSSFRKIIELQVQDQDPSLWAVATILGATSLAYSAVSIHQGSVSSISDVVQTFLLLRGIGVVSHPLRGPSRDSRLMPILSGFYIERCNDRDVPSEASHQLEQIRIMIEDTCVASERQALLEAHNHLKLVYAEVACTRGTANSNPIMVVKWATLVSQGYIALLKSYRPPALVLFAHFALLLRIFRDTWFLQGWAAQCIVAVKNSLPPSWTHWLCWPEEQLQKELQLFENEDMTAAKWEVESCSDSTLSSGMALSHSCVKSLAVSIVT